MGPSEGFEGVSERPRADDGETKGHDAADEVLGTSGPIRVRRPRRDRKHRRRRRQAATPPRDRHLPGQTCSLLCRPPNFSHNSLPWSSSNGRSEQTFQKYPNLSRDGKTHHTLDVTTHEPKMGEKALRRRSSVTVVRNIQLLISGVKGKKRKMALERQMQFAATLTDVKLAGSLSYCLCARQLCADVLRLM